MRPKLTMAESMPGLLFHRWDLLGFGFVFRLWCMKFKVLEFHIFSGVQERKTRYNATFFGKLITIKNKHVLDTGRA